MFILQMEDGSVLVETQQVNCWDDVPTDTKIKSVTVTDGNKVSHTLSGFEYYVVCYEATKIATIGGPGGQRDGAHRQIVYGIRSNTMAKRLLKKQHQHVIASIKLTCEKARKVADGVIIVNAQTNSLKEAEENLNKLLSSLDNMEVVKVTFGAEVEELTRDKFTMLDSTLRDGIPNEPDSTFEENAYKSIFPQRKK